MAITTAGAAFVNDVIKNLRSPRRRPFRSGIAIVLAMLFLVLFATLALGFYAAVSTSVQVSGNERRANEAMLAAESGMAFIKYQLASLNIPGGTSPDQLFNVVYTQLSSQLNGTSNMGDNTVQLSADQTTITVPGPSGAWINLDDSGSQFQASIKELANGQQLEVRVTGQVSGINVSRSIQLDYAVARNASDIFNYGVATNGTLALSGNAKIQGKTDPAKGSVLTTATGTGNEPITMSGNCTISGDVSMANPDGSIGYSGNVSIGGSSSPAGWASHVHTGVTAPTFPTVDTDAFAAYATTDITGQPSGKSFSNIRIKANANPSFSGNTTIKGVMYIETPNRVTFSGNTTIQGVIVVQNNPTGTNNALTFSGNVSATGPETLPASYGDLRNLTGSFILRTNFALTMSGNFGTIGGSIVVGSMTFSGNAGGTVNGTVISTTSDPVRLSGNSTITINSQSTSNYPAGVFFGSHFAPLPATYVENPQ